MTDDSEKNSNSSAANNLLNNESFCEISSSSLDAGNESGILELEQMVAKILEKIKAISHQGDLNVNDLMDVIMPKIRNEMFDLEKVYKEVRNIQESLDRYLQQAQTVDQDIADMFLDLHNIYGKLEKLDDSGRKLSSQKRAKLLRHAKEAEEMQNRSRHYLTNDPKEMSAELVGPPREAPSNPKGN
ncbi:uncharacterized protein LOC108138704 isoform X2 [Drosophila elegans]|uniref:uncharacterized protein LOC108138704 isoform X2 n=1 Tax=Drosophila elegans TaxID=30023 RepID=UPI0007E7D4EE|nr:uncharacterized protein LOC108138704 isoform X2 [Drosophila elegans]